MRASKRAISLTGIVKKISTRRFITTQPPLISVWRCIGKTWDAISNTIPSMCSTRPTDRSSRRLQRVSPLDSDRQEMLLAQSACFFSGGRLNDRWCVSYHNEKWLREGAYDTPSRGVALLSLAVRFGCQRECDLWHVTIKVLWINLVTVTCHIKIDVNFERFGIFVAESGLSLTVNRSVCKFFLNSL